MSMKLQNQNLEATESELAPQCWIVEKVWPAREWNGSGASLGCLGAAPVSFILSSKASLVASGRLPANKFSLVNFGQQFLREKISEVDPDLHWSAWLKSRGSGSALRMLVSCKGKLILTFFKTLNLWENFTKILSPPTSWIWTGIRADDFVIVKEL